MTSFRRLAAVAVLLACAAACADDGDGLPPPASCGETHDVTRSAVDSGLPCDVMTTVVGCDACHGGQHPDDPVVFRTWQDLQGPSTVLPGKSLLYAALSRMKDGSMPPAPLPRKSPEAIAAWEAWVARGAPSGTCDTDAPGADLAHADKGRVCSSGVFSTERVGPLMAPGSACFKCHDGKTAPAHGAMGTIYPSLHELDGCRGVPGVTIDLTDADGVHHVATTNEAGNFVIDEQFPVPYAFTLRHGDWIRTVRPESMSINRDCNSCHSEVGCQGAPGRPFVK